MDLNKIYEKIINLVIIPKYDFISGIETLKVTKDDIDRISVRVNFYLKASWADVMFVNRCQKRYLSGGEGLAILHIADMDDCVFNGFYTEKNNLINDLYTINKMVGYTTNLFGTSFVITFVLDFKN